MTEPTDQTTPDPGTPPTGGTPGNDDTPASPDTPTEPDPSSEDTGSREAASWRRKLRTVEQERDTLASQVAALRRAELDRIATTGDGPRLYDAADVWPADADLADVLDDAGRVDAARVREVVAERTEDRAHLRADRGRSPRPDPTQGSGRGAVGPSRGEGWSALLSGR